MNLLVKIFVAERAVIFNGRDCGEEAAAHSDAPSAAVGLDTSFLNLVSKRATYDASLQLDIYTCAQ